ncbi:MAG: DUF4837 family protein, partial [Balneolaceae bacterium]
MKSLIKTTLLLIVVATWFGCEGDYRQEAKGNLEDVTVVMDSTQFNSKTSDAIRGTFGKGIQTLPNVQPLYDLNFRDFKNNNELENLKQSKNIIFAAPINDSTNVSRFIRALLSDEVEQKVENGEVFAFPLQDKWYRNQWTMILTAPSDSALARQIENSEQTLTENLLQKEFDRWTTQLYDRGEQVGIEDSIWAKHGWKIRIQHDWGKHLDTTYT